MEVVVRSDSSWSDLRVPAVANIIIVFKPAIIPKRKIK